MSMKGFIVWAGVAAAAAGLPAAPAAAGPILVSGTMTATPDGPDFDYTITLTNSAASTDPIRTFWFAWMPGKDFMPTGPISETAPPGWTATVTHFPDVPTNGFAVQFVTSTAPLMPGESLAFLFKSADSPDRLAGDSPFYPGTPVGTSFVYSGAPFQGDSASFVVSSVPEPSSLAQGVVGVLASCAGWGVRRGRVRRRGAS